MSFLDAPLNLPKDFESVRPTSHPSAAALCACVSGREKQEGTRAETEQFQSRSKERVFNLPQRLRSSKRASPFRSRAGLIPAFGGERMTLLACGSLNYLARSQPACCSGRDVAGRDLFTTADGERAAGWARARAFYAFKIRRIEMSEKEAPQEAQKKGTYRDKLPISPSRVRSPPASEAVCVGMTSRRPLLTPLHLRRFPAP